VPLKRLSEKTELKNIRKGYVINMRPKKAYIHTSNCVTVTLMNPTRKEKGGVYHAESLEEAVQWIKEEGLKQSPCRLCLPTLTYKPKSSRLVL